MKLTHLFNNTCTQPNTATSHWLSCSQDPKTLSFRSILRDEAFKAANKISYCNDSPKCSTAFVEDLLEDGEEGGETMERVIRGLKSDRLFFEPGETNSILGEAKKASSSNGCRSNVEKAVTLLSMESNNPYLDFKQSMVEMVEAHGVGSWDWLQELLGCYLKVNGKSNHRFIIRAFVELLVSLDLEGLGLSCSSFVASSSSPVAFSSSDISTSCCSSSNLPADEAAALDDGSVDEMMLTQTATSTHCHHQCNMQASS
uniref:Transcription repressor n=1 Tax=Kalanchoe fedtschenkoi TaxID=63787 RepID=A0A7N0UNB2_KALFE